MLKRSPLKTKAQREWQKPERQRVVFHDVPPVVRAVMGSVVLGAAVPKDAPKRSEAYRRWVAEQPCIACGLAERSQAAHSNSPQHGKALGLKADDRNLFPLCTSMPGRMGCHEHHDLSIGMTREERREREAVYVTRMQQRAVKAGWDLETLRRKV